MKISWLILLRNFDFFNKSTDIISLVFCRISNVEDEKADLTLGKGSPRINSNKLIQLKDSFKLEK